MKNKQKKWRKIFWKLYVIVGAVYLTIFAGTLTFSGTLDSVDNAVSDAIYQLINRNRNESMIKIVMIDSKTVEELGEYESWSRSKTAEFIEVLNSVPKDAPKVIGLNLNYSGEKDKKGDAMLEKACKKYDNICIGTPIIFQEGEEEVSQKEGFLLGESALLQEEESVSLEESELSQEEGVSLGESELLQGKEGASLGRSVLLQERRGMVLLPYQALMPYVITGVTNIVKYSSDGFIRNAVANISIDGEVMDSFAVAVYKMYKDSIGDSYILPRLDIENSFAFNYSKKSEDYIAYSFYDVITGAVPASTFRNCMVLLGDCTTEKRIYKVPNQRNLKMAEIEVQANILEALMTQKTGQNVSKWFLSIWYGLFVGTFFVITFFSSGLRTILKSALLFAVQLLICCILNKFGYYVPVFIPILFVLIITTINLIISYVLAKQERAALEGVFKKYVDKQVVDEIVKTGGVKAKIGVVRKDIAVLFVDLRGFTALSESLEPEQIVDILNTYLTLVANAVKKNGGTLDKFIGDAAMAVFNSPTDLEDYVYWAVCTAWDISQSSEKLKKTYLEKYGKSVTFGIGVHCGEAVIGNIGCKSRMDYTAIGDTVNTASRLEGVAKAGQILISKEVKDRVKGRIMTEFAGEELLKGKKEKVSTYEITGVYKIEKEENPKNSFGRRNA